MKRETIGFGKPKMEEEGRKQNNITFDPKRHHVETLTCVWRSRCRRPQENSEGVSAPLRKVVPLGIETNSTKQSLNVPSNDFTTTIGDVAGLYARRYHNTKPICQCGCVSSTSQIAMEPELLLGQVSEKKRTRRLSTEVYLVVSPR